MSDLLLDVFKLPPLGFSPPPRGACEAMEPGRMCMLLARLPPGSKRDHEPIWVRVQSVKHLDEKARRASGRPAIEYRGQVRTAPRISRDLRHGDLVRFEPRHVADIS